MGMIYLMLIVSLIMALVFLFGFFWANKTGQFEDDYTPSIRILFEEETNQNKKQETDGSTEV